VQQHPRFVELRRFAKLDLSWYLRV